MRGGIDLNVSQFILTALFLVITGGIVSAQPQITIVSPPNATIDDTTPTLNITTSEPSNITYSWDNEGNITGAFNATSYTTTYGEAGKDANSSGLWHMNEGMYSNIIDDSGNLNTGTIYGASWTSDCRFGNCLEFDGVDDYVEVSDSSSLAISGEITIMAWIKPNAHPEENPCGWHTIVEKYDDDYGLYVHQRHCGGGSGGPWDARVVLWFYNESNEFWVSGNTLITPDEWHHIAGTYSESDGQLKVYLDGELDGGKNFSGAIQTSGNTLKIGGNSGDMYFNGTIDDIVIHNRALDGSEILDIYQKTLPSGQHIVVIYADIAARSSSRPVYFTMG
jgi:hypothetical protein